MYTYASQVKLQKGVYVHKCVYWCVLMHTKIACQLSMHSLFKILLEAYLYLQTSVYFSLSVAYKTDGLQVC